MIVITSNTILLHTINFLIFSKHVKGDNKVCNMKQSGFLKEGSTCYVQLYLYEYQKHYRHKRIFRCNKTFWSVFGRDLVSKSNANDEI